MTRRLDARRLYELDGREGPWRYVGQAVVVDDHGGTFEHDWVRMVQDDEEEWVPLSEVTLMEVQAMPLHLLRDESPTSGEAA